MNTARRNTLLVLAIGYLGITGALALELVDRFVNDDPLAGGCEGVVQHLSDVPSDFEVREAVRTPQGNWCLTFEP